NKSMQYISYFLNVVLLFFIVAICGAIFSLGAKVPDFGLPIIVRIIIELVYYISVLFLFYSNGKFDIDIWIRSLLLFVIIRISLGLLNTIVFTIMADEITFSVAFNGAMYGHPLIHFIQFLSIPFLAFPIVFGYSRAQTEKEFNEFDKFNEEGNSAVEYIPIGQIEEQIIPLKIWQQFFKTEDREELQSLLKGIKLSPYAKNLVIPQEATKSVSDIEDILNELIPSEAPQETVGNKISEKAIPNVPLEELSREVPPPITSSQVSAVPDVSELSELEQLLSVAESTEETEKIPQEISIEENPTEAVVQTADRTEEISQVPEIPSAELPMNNEKAPEISLEMPEIPEIPLELPDSLIPEETPIEEKHPIEEPTTPPVSASAPSGTYAINSSDDFFKISLRRLIELNQGKQGAKVLERLIKRGANFELSVPMTLLIPHLREGRANLTVEYVYSEIPIELVNFMSSDQSGDLSEIELELPLNEIMAQTNPKIIFSGSAPQEESKWVKSSEEMDIDKVFENIPSTASTDDEEIVEEDEGKVLDVGDVSDIPLIEVSPDEIEENSGFPKPLLEFASQNGVAPMLEQSDKISIVLLCPIGGTLGTIVPLAEWLAETKISPRWTTAPNYIFVDSEMASAAMRIDNGMKTQRDDFILVTAPQDILKIHELLNNAYELAGYSKNEQVLEFSDVKPLPFVADKHIEEPDGYKGAWARLPGKTIIVTSAISDDEDHWAEIAGVGTKFVEFISGMGRMFAVWQRIILYSDGWALGILPMPGGIMIIEIPEGKQIQEVDKELQDVSHSLIGVAK
ncbi:hypothetical protein J7L68_09685, partial [bacterium]|nr:hypothetical protein [bacterium]